MQIKINININIYTYKYKLLYYKLHPVQTHPIFQKFYCPVFGEFTIQQIRWKNTKKNIEKL